MVFPPIIAERDCQFLPSQARDSEGNTLLHWAALFPNLELLRILIDECQISLSSTTKQTEQTPFMWSLTKTAHFRVHRFLLSHPTAVASLRAKDSLGATPFIIAVQHSNDKAFFLLLGKDANVVLDTDNNGCSAIHWAAFKGEEAMIKVLLAYGSSFSGVDAQLMTPLHRAVMGGRIYLAQTILEMKADVNVLQKDHSGKTALDMLSPENDSYAHKMLLAALRRHFPREYPVGGTVGPKSAGDDVLDFVDVEDPGLSDFSEDGFSSKQRRGCGKQRCEKLRRALRRRNITGYTGPGLGLLLFVYLVVWLMCFLGDKDALGVETELHL